jgi:Concanavalin A-like lectin/glucanases superfamily
MNTSNATFLAWVNLAGNQSSYSGLVMCNGGTTWSGMMIQSGTKLGYQWNDASATWNYNSGPVLPTNQWALAAVSVTNNRALFYVGLTNGSLVITTNNYTHIFQAFDSYEYVGTDPFGGRNINGLIEPRVEHGGNRADFDQRYHWPKFRRLAARPQYEHVHLDGRGGCLLDQFAQLGDQRCARCRKYGIFQRFRRHHRHPDRHQSFGCRR